MQLVELSNPDSLPEHPVPIIPPIVFQGPSLPAFTPEEEMTYSTRAWVKLSVWYQAPLIQCSGEAYREEKRDAIFLENAVNVFPSGASLAAKITIGLWESKNHSFASTQVLCTYRLLREFGPSQTYRCIYSLKDAIHAFH